METARTAGPYRPRHPERTVLYRVLAQHFERFVQVYDERLAPTHGPLANGAQEAVYRYLDCGIFANGFARVRCGECGYDFFVAFSCKLRCICPSCHTKRELIWSQWAAEELLEDVPHRQVVFTIPKRLRVYFRYDHTHDPLPAGARASVARSGHRRGAVPHATLACRTPRGTRRPLGRVRAHRPGARSSTPTAPSAGSLLGLLLQRFTRQTPRRGTTPRAYRRT